MNWNQQTEEPKPRTPEEVRQAFALLFGEEYIAPIDHNHAEKQPEQTRPEIDFPELENPSTTLALQQNEPVQNPSETRFSDSKTDRSPYEPQRGPRGSLNELPEPTQQKILELLQNHTNEKAAEILSQPVPEGLGFPVSRKMLERFEKRHRVIEHRADIEATAMAARELATDPNTNDTDLITATLRIIRAAVLEYATDIQNFEALERLNDVLHKLRRADIADRRQTYLEHKENNHSSGLKDRPHKSPGRSPGSQFEAASRSERAQHSTVDNSQLHANAIDKPSAKGN